MEQQGESSGLEPLRAFVGEWSVAADFPGSPSSGIAGRTVFDWLPGERFLVQRWEVEHPAAPEGIALIGAGPGNGDYLQHYFDSRGVARVHEGSTTST